MLSAASVMAQHDHSHHSHGSEHENDMPMPMMMMMPMYFWQGTDVTYLFESLESKTGGGYFAGLVATFALGFVIECISFLRKYCHMKA